ncbi:hypothetical protein PUNSTDRAFT_139671 [Punctularia strigosozonata HHB-11173 SS5]|uniref:Uncharacterized protein n=1 Tax=Punctularia strigosozonata (strain HHB-11173) TaxID=741275 RepID=R7RYW8_PUNST|nr:uncharacterized protein PUNSTDRAFT_139671 [Punctularia strigosozonata HHB-11173 SS5]EIN03310.1 hypothetical protein PUNSTDRAFT_139671 [Punctularia strigosozonata HHB-11173 SS5]
MPPWALRDNAFDKPHYRLNRAALVELAEALGVEPGGNVHELKARTKQALFERRDELIEHPTYSALYTEREKNEFQQGRTQGTGDEGSDWQGIADYQEPRLPSVSTRSQSRTTDQRMSLRGRRTRSGQGGNTSTPAPSIVR